MRHLGFGILVSAAAMMSASSALAADLDYPDDMRSSYNSWDEPMTPLMEFEAGVRYMYSVGGQNVDAGGRNFSADYTGHTAELFLRMNDLATNSYLKAYGGYSGMLEGTMNNSGLGISGPMDSGRMAYAVFDLGYQPLHWEDGDNSAGLGVFAGYQYLNDSPNLGRGNYATIDSIADVGWNRSTGSPIYGGDSAANDVNINALRLGVSGDADFGAINFSGEFAAIPYAMVTGTAPAPLYIGGGNVVQSSPTTYQGSAFGASTELMAGTSINNWNFRVGGRAMYLTGSGSTHYEVASMTNAIDSDTPPDGIYETDGQLGLQNVRTDMDAFSLWRYGILAEISIDF